MHIQASAKINLGLRIHGKRDDGFHELETIFAELDTPTDEIELTKREDSSIKWSAGPMPWGKETDLSYRAARLLQKTNNVSAGADIRLKKHIPVGAGLGGGSSDAAAVLKGLNDLWDLNLSLDELEGLAAELGSDCSFFIRGGVQRGTGRGEVLSPVSLPDDFPREVALLCPEVHINTGAAYASLGSVPTPGTTPGDLGLDLTNDFEPVIFAQHPELAELKQKLLDAGASAASLSGSGSTVFGLFHERKEIPGVVWGRIVTR